MAEDDFGIGAALPELDEETVSKIVIELGLRTESDLMFVQENDLKPWLKTIQARRLLAAWAKTSRIAPASEIRQTQPLVAIDASWHLNFSIPWSSFPGDMLTCCYQGKIPNPNDRCAMVRILADSILQANKNPRGKELDWIAAKVVSKYPDSLKDQSDVTPIGTGFSGLANQVRWRVNYVNKKSKEAQAQTPKKQTPTKGHENKEYGCNNWAPPIVNVQTQEEIRLWLTSEFKKNERDSQQISPRMKETYPLQRYTINNNASIESLQKDWPFLFFEDELYCHYTALTGKNVKQGLLTELESRCSRVFEALETSNTGKILLIRELEKIKVLCEVWGNDSPKAVSFLQLLVRYFDEKTSFIFGNVKDSANEITIPPSPFIVGHGPCLVSATKYEVFIECQPVFETPSILNAICYMFCAFFVFNIEYPKEALATLEFIQSLSGLQYPWSMVVLSSKADSQLHQVIILTLTIDSSSQQNSALVS